MKWSIFFINIIIHVGIMALFLTIFFFTIAQYFEKKIIEDQIDFVIDDFVGNSLKPVSEKTKKEIRHEINSAFDKQDLSKADESVKKENTKISTKAWIFVGTMLGIILVIVLTFGFKYRWERYYLKFLFNSALISLIFVAITETLFMFLIAQNYLSADPNQIKMKIIQTLDKNRCDPCKDKDCIGSITGICPAPKFVN
jgi:predicted PurR-regulated permease PerM